MAGARLREIRVSLGDAELKRCAAAEVDAETLVREAVAAAINALPPLEDEEE